MAAVSSQGVDAGGVGVGPEELGGHLPSSPSSSSSPPTLPLNDDDDGNGSGAAGTPASTGNSCTTESEGEEEEDEGWAPVVADEEDRGPEDEGHRRLDASIAASLREVRGRRLTV